jgi:hypothetical protein
MADYASGLPVRTEADGADERLHVKVVDGTTPAQRMTVDTDGNAHVEMHGNDPAGTDRVVRTSELGALTPDGVYDVADNTKPGNLGIIASSRDAAPSDSTQTERITSVTDSGGTVKALDMSLHDENGNAYTPANPLPVTISESEGTEVNDYNTAASVAASATSNHDYTVTALNTLTFTQFSASASGKCKIVVSVETAVASGVFTPKFVMFNSTANPNMDKTLREPMTVAAGVRVRIARTNLDNQPQDLYSTISGHETV